MTHIQTHTRKNTQYFANVIRMLSVAPLEQVRSGKRLKATAEIHCFLSENKYASDNDTECVAVKWHSRVISTDSKYPNQFWN